MGIDDDELAALRRRAYAEDADIASDPAALARLAELESRDTATAALPERTPEPAAWPPRSDHQGSGPAECATDVAEQTSDGTRDEPTTDADDGRLRRFAWPRPQRSTVVLVAVGALVAVSCAVALTVVQRVQTHPLQPDAVQVARVTPDPAFDVPDFFALGPADQAIAFTETHGFRAIVTPPGGALGAGEYCMTVYQPALVTAQGAGSWSYDGQYIAPVCSAGTFPAAATVRLLPGSPELEHTDFPADTALQFVYDQPTNEVVLFRG
ncbi:hypothetical protein M3672_09875 [Microbacterium enclense]|uniref:hypothetical protein n=1 Tax=Microbacterium enclense TaxID=993073 RepID=UPI00203E66EC|nr:hypothetical protein [Microbacterium enclense]MCM3614741.1 hypothetical protein [Microbacterium enclense]